MGARSAPQIPADGSWPKSVCDYLRKLCNGHTRNVNQIAKKEKERKALAEQIDQLDDRERNGRKGEALKAECYDVEQALKAHRAQVRWYADKMADGIRGADQGELFEDARTVPTQDDLFSAGRKKADDWRSRKVESLEGLGDIALAKLKEAKLTTLGKVQDFRASSDIASLGLEVSDAEIVNGELDKLLKAEANPLGEDGEDDGESDAENALQSDDVDGEEDGD